MVTLRGVRMYEFLDRFVTVALPRVRDFRGISGRAFDGRGNYNIGVKEQIIFPEIDYDKIDAIRGMNISITTSAKTDDECKALLVGVQVPVQELKHRREGNMAKQSLIQREQKREKLVAKYEKKYDELQVIARDGAAQRRRALRRTPGASEAAAQRQPDAPAQPLRSHGPPAWHVPQVRSRTQQDPRPGLQGRHPRCRQGQLVSRGQQIRRIPYEHE